MLPKGGNLLFLSGPAGNSQGLDELEGLKSVLGPEYKFLNPEPFDVTNWDPALTQKVLTAEIAKNPKIDVIVSDFGPSLVGALPRSSNPAGRSPRLPHPTAIRWAASGPTVHEDNPDFKLFTVSTENDNVRLAVQWAVAAATGGKSPQEEIFKGPVFENSVTGKPHPVNAARIFPVRSICRPNCLPTIRPKRSTPSSIARAPEAEWPPGHDLFGKCRTWMPSTRNPRREWS